jgi:hypothetical protein
MTEHFNKLTPAEAERLSLLLEEMGESLQIIGKIQRHGYESIDPTGRVQGTNRQLLQIELGHVMHAIQRMMHVGDVDAKAIFSAKTSGRINVNRYLHHQEEEAVMPAEPCPSQ